MKHAPTPPPLYGLILNGGKSSRMKTDKSKLVYHSKDQIQHLTLLLSKICEEVFVSSKKLTSDYNNIIDKYNLNSPLNAVLSAFAEYPDASWLIIACDMPLINEQTLKKLVKNQDLSKLAITYLNPEDKLPEPLITIWNPNSYPLLLDFYTTGNKSPRRFLIKNIHQISTLLPFDKNELFNANTPEEKEIAEQIISNQLKKKL